MIFKGGGGGLFRDWGRGEGGEEGGGGGKEERKVGM